MYRLLYLPLAQKDLEDIADYIIDKLKAPQAALDFVDSLDEAVSRLLVYPYAYKIFQSVKSLELEYRVLPINNYLVFYVVGEDYVEIHRIIYARRDLPQFIKDS